MERPTTTPQEARHQDDAVTLAALQAAMEAALPGLTEDDRTLARVLIRKLAEGKPVETVDISPVVGRPAADVEAMLTNGPLAPLTYRDRDGRIIGFVGLGLPELSTSPHELDIAGRTLYAWCSFDTLFLPIALGQRIGVRSTSPVDEAPISLLVGPRGVDAVTPTTTTLSALMPAPEGMSGDVIRSFCHYIHFFAGPDEAGGWVGDHEGTFELPLADAVRLARSWAAYVFGTRAV